MAQLLAAQGPEFKSPTHKCWTWHCVSKTPASEVRDGKILELIGKSVHLTESLPSNLSEMSQMSQNIRLRVIKEESQYQPLTSTDTCIHIHTHSRLPIHTIVWSLI